MKINISFIALFSFCLVIGCKQVKFSNHDHNASESIQMDEEEIAGHNHESEYQDYTHFYGEEEVEVMLLKKQKFHEILKTSGVLLPSREDIQVYHSTANGFIHFADKNMVPGTPVRKGEILFKIQGGILSEENSDLKFKDIQLEYEMEKKNFERAESLIEDKVISEEDFLEIRKKYENAKNHYQLFLENREQSGQVVISKANGFVQKIRVSEGDYINAGKELATTIAQNKLILRVDVPQQNLNQLTSFNSATFTTPYGNSVYRTDDLGGQLLAFGKSTDETSFFTPVFFEIDYQPDLIPGSFVEVNLIGRPVDEALVVPKSALMEEQSKIYVFIQQEDGEFEKRYIKLGANDGEYFQVLAGIEENQKVVVAGAYFVKLSTLSTDLPDTHSH